MVRARAKLESISEFNLIVHAFGLSENQRRITHRPTLLLYFFFLRRFSSHRFYFLHFPFRYIRSRLSVISFVLSAIFFIAISSPQSTSTIHDSLSMESNFLSERARQNLIHLCSHPTRCDIYLYLYLYLYLSFPPSARCSCSLI